MEAGHVPIRPAAGLASAWQAVCRLPAAGPWLWLARSCPPGGFAAKLQAWGAFAPEATPAVLLVLLDGLPGLLVAAGQEVLGHG